MSGSDDRRGSETRVRDTDKQSDFEAWMHHDLTQRFDSTLDEPIPSELLALLKSS